ncbi:MAG: CusA/CzcA family heavy metal efflux RND transporter, partial [Geopsychrobacter sp.]|nr:CusA/CzcA family heavy metal efflux RND transporter [Geopsychrobacter sp.]
MEKIIRLVLQSRLLMCVLGVVVIGAGWYSYNRLPVDAFPDVTPALVQVFTETEGLAPEEVEKYVTYPVEVAMNGLPKLKKIRSVSNFGLSVINIYFEDGTDIFFARQLVGERLQQAREEIPPGFGEPVMGPISTGLGQILFYVVEDEIGNRSPEEMREIQDWLIKFNIQTVPGVTEVLSIGGEVKQFQVQIRPADLLRYDLTLNDIVETVRANNSNVGAQFLVKNAEEYIVRSVGLAEKLEDLEKIVLKVKDGTPIYLEQVADVVIGGEIRRGLVTMDGKGEAMVGMILKLIGTNTSQVIKDVKLKIEKVNQVLPEGIKIVPYYDQATLVKKCVNTVTKALLEAGVLIVIIQLLMLGGIRPSAVVLASIPFSLAFAFFLMNYFGVSANLMSLGGLAIALGLLVDGSVVMIENIDRHIHTADPDESMRQIVLRASAEVARPIVFSLLIIVIVFIPLFTLQGVEGKTFRPLAQTMSFAIFGSLVFTILLAPVLSSLLMRRPKKTGEHKELLVVRWMLAVYRPAVTLFVRRPVIPIALSAGLLVVGIFLFTQLGSEFVPRLNEGDLLIRATMAPSISLDEASINMGRFERRLMAKFPEVTRVVTRVGRGEVGAHADPINNAEAFVALKPQDEWVSGETPDELYAAIGEFLEDFPGAQFNVTQPIAAAVDELLTGTKAALAIKIFGEDMEILKQKAAEIEAVIRDVPGAADVQKDQVTGTPQL